MELSGKKALIIGGGGGIGQCIAKALHAKGATVYIQYRNTKPDIAYIRYLHADLSNSSSINALISEYIEQAINLDILINCLGDFLYKPLSDLQPSEFERIIHSNLQIAFEICHQALPYLRKAKNARILQIAFSGSTNLTAKPSILPYHIAKLGLILLTRSLAQTEASHSILANTLSPGIVENNQYDSAYSIPLDRSAKLSEIVEASLFLLCSDYITGADLQIDGGWLGKIQ